MELKFGLPQISICIMQGSNRTFMELKFASCAFSSAAVAF